MTPTFRASFADAPDMGSHVTEFRALGYLITGALVLAAVGLAAVTAFIPAVPGGVTRLLWLLIGASGAVMVASWVAVGSMMALRRWIRA